MESFLQKQKLGEHIQMFIWRVEKVLTRERGGSSLQSFTAIMLIEIALIILSLILISIYQNLWRYSSKLPPGPFPFPLVGSIPKLALSMRNLAPYEGFQQMAKKYGPIMGIHFGRAYQVVVHDPDVIREILSSDTWVDRYFDEFMAERSFGKVLGIIFISGDVWKEMRKFSVRTLRDFGFGKQKSMEASLTEEMSDLSTRLDKYVDEDSNNSIPMRQIFAIPVLNVLWTMIAGVRFAHDNEKLTELVGLIAATSKANPINGNIVKAFPFLRQIVRNITTKGRQRAHFVKQMHKYFNNILKERRLEGVYKEEQRDFIDVFLKEIDDHSKDTSEQNFYTDEQFVMVSFDLFVAGAETTSNTLEFAILYMILNPKVQEKVQAEIDQVVGRSRPPSLLDKSQMPYTEATLMEVQRMTSVLPINLRANTEETKLGAYTVPKGTVAVLNMYSMHMSESLWNEPHVFKPERFFDSKTGSVINSHKILPFGLGKRVCIGEVLARAALFSFFTSVLQKYTLEKSADHSEPSSTPVLGFTLSPESYHVNLKYR